MALLSCSVRSSSVTAITDVTLYELQKVDFGDIVLPAAAFKVSLARSIEDYSGFTKIKTLQPFQLLEPDKMYAVMEKMTERNMSPVKMSSYRGKKAIPTILSSRDV